MSEKEKIYEVTVNTGGSFDKFETYQKDIFRNVLHGNENMIFITATDGMEIAIPTRFMVTHKEKE